MTEQAKQMYLSKTAAINDLLLGSPDEEIWLCPNICCEGFEGRPPLSNYDECCYCFKCPKCGQYMGVVEDE